MCAAMRATARPRDGLAPEAQIAAAAPVRVGHDRLPADLVERDVLRRMARRRGDRHRGEDALGIARPPIAAPASPPIEPPITQNSCSMPRWSISSFCARTMSRIVMTGKRQRPRLAGRRVDVLRARSCPCSRRARWRRSGNSARCRARLPGPTSVVHQPGLPVIGCGSATYWSPVSAWQIRIAFVRSALSVP